MVGTGFAMEGTRKQMAIVTLKKVSQSSIVFQGFIIAMWCMNCWARCLGGRYCSDECQQCFLIEFVRGQLRIFPSGSLNTLLEGWSCITNGVKIIFVRYGVRDPLAGRAWQLLSESVYSSSVRWRALPFLIIGMIKLNRNFHGKVLIVRPPKLGIR